MEIVVNYSQVQFDNAVSFISSNNPFFLGKDEEINTAMLGAIHQLAIDKLAEFYSSMGFTLIADREFESMDRDENICRIEIMVDPSIHAEIDDISDNDLQEFILNI